MLSKVKRFILMPVLLAALLMGGTAGIVTADEATIGADSGHRPNLQEMVAEYLGISVEDLQSAKDEARNIVQDIEDPEARLEEFKAAVNEILVTEYGTVITLQEAIEAAKAAIRERLEARKAEMREQLEARRAEMREQLEARRAEMRGQLEARRVEMRERLEARKAEMREQLEARKAEMREQLEARRAEMREQSAERQQQRQEQRAEWPGNHPNGNDTGA